MLTVKAPAAGVRLWLQVALLRLIADAPVLWMLVLLHSQGEGPGGVAAAAFNAALFTAFAVIHSALARPAAKRALAGLVGPLCVRPLFVVVGGLTLACVLYLWRPLAGELWRAKGPAHWILTLLFVAVAAGLIWAATFIDYAEFLGIRALVRSARGRPPKPAVFSARGPYAYCRHPMYAFLLLALWVGPVMTLGRLELAALASLYLLAGTFFEETSLREELGGVYDVYRANVPMWVPRLSPWRFQGENQGQRDDAA